MMKHSIINGLLLALAGTVTLVSAALPRTSCQHVGQSLHQVCGLWMVNDWDDVRAELRNPACVAQITPQHVMVPAVHWHGAPRDYDECIQGILGALVANPPVVNHLPEDTIGGINPAACQAVRDIAHWREFVIGLNPGRRARIRYECLETVAIRGAIAADGNMHQFTLLMAQLPGLLANFDQANHVQVELARGVNAEAFRQAFVDHLTNVMRS